MVESGAASQKQLAERNHALPSAQGPGPAPGGTQRLGAHTWTVPQATLADPGRRPQSDGLALSASCQPTTASDTASLEAK